MSIKPLDCATHGKCLGRTLGLLLESRSQLLPTVRGCGMVPTLSVRELAAPIDEITHELHTVAWRAKSRVTWRWREVRDGAACQQWSGQRAWPGVPGTRGEGRGKADSERPLQVQANTLGNRASVHAQ
jgi:hypothetical protein